MRASHLPVRQGELCHLSETWRIALGADANTIAHFIAGGDR